MEIYEILETHGLDKHLYAVDWQAIISFSRLNAHYRATADATRTYSKSQSWLASVGWTQKSSYQAVDWAKQKKLKEQYHQWQLASVLMPLRGKDAQGVRRALYQMYTMRFEAEEKVRAEAHRITGHNQGVVNGAMVATQRAQMMRDAVFVSLSVISVPASGGAAFVCAVNVVGSGYNKYVDSGGNMEAAIIESAGGLVGLGFGKLSLNATGKTGEILGVLAASADGYAETFGALAEGKKLEEAIGAGLTKAGITGGGGLIAGRMAAKLSGHGDDLVKGINYFKRARGDRLGRAAAAGETVAGVGAGIIAKEVGRDPLEGHVPQQARTGPRKKNYQEFRDMMESMVWMRWKQHLDSPAEFRADR